MSIDFEMMKIKNVAQREAFFREFALLYAKEFFEEWGERG